MKRRLRIGIVALGCTVIGIIAAGAALLSDSTFFTRTDDIAAEQIKYLPSTDPAVATFWADTVATQGGTAAYALFGDVYAYLGEAQQHTYAHVFGEALYKEEGIPGVAVCDARYGFGCYHSFFGWALVDNGLSILKDLDEACIAAYGPKGLGCQHGIGHGIIAELGYDELDRSLEACMLLDWQGPIGGCTSGVFMEYNFATMQQSATREPDERGMFYPCTAVGDRFREACYFELPAWWGALNDNDYEAVGALCGQVTQTAYREACYRGAGNIIAGLQEYDLPQILAACELMPDREGVMLCTEGAVWIVSNQPQFRDTWRSLCDSMEGEYYDRCIMSHDLI